MTARRSSRRKLPVPGRESLKARKERAARIVERLADAYPDADCALRWTTPWELLAATILSAQCTDEMVNQVTPGLFEQYPDPASLARAPLRKVETLIRRTGFFNQKAKALKECAGRITKEHGGQVPDDMASLTALRGVGRKTASVVLGTAFGEAAVFVDTHVRRLTGRLGLTTHSDPDKIEGDIRELVAPPEWTAFCHRLIHHGRQICTARKPRCEECPVGDLCPRVGVPER